jgi:hypothetical protein
MNDANGVPDDVMHFYELTSNAIASLAINAPSASFQAKANVVEFFPFEMKPPVSLMGNCAMVLDIKNNYPWLPFSLPDMVGITVYMGKSKGGIWYSNNWVNNKTIMDFVCGGGLIVGGPAGPVSPDGHEAEVTQVKSGEILTDALQPGLKVYPNPFAERIFFEFVPAKDSRAKLDIYNVTGQKMATLIDREVTAGEELRLEFDPGQKANGIYFYTLMIDNELKTGKIMHKR